VTLASYIEQDLEARLRSRKNLPETLTLDALATSYDVSLTPVRTAVGELVRRKLLRREQNGRLAPNPAELAKHSPRRNKPSPPIDWDTVLANEMLLVSLNGQEVFAREEALAERHRIGRTLLRQVFHRLAGRGLLEHVPRRGWRVHPFREEDMIAYLDVRETLEVKALDLARRRLVTADLEAMLAGNLPSTRGDSPHLDNDLHQYFIERSGNRYIQGFFAAYGGYYTALFDYAALGASVEEEMARQHREILTHILARRWAKARTALANHIRAQQPVSMKVIEILRERSCP
jgi:DNA-binding GntR family transcriptional regulator